MVKILSQAGTSLADMYNVQGSIAGIDQLESNEVTLAHEMGALIFSERLSGAIRRASSGAILQTTTFDIVLNDLPSGIARILGVMVLSANGSRVANASVYVRDDAAGREVPIFLWDSTQTILTVRMEENAGGAVALNVLTSDLNSAFLPSLLIGVGQPQRVNSIAFRGLSTTFGAGTVTVTAVIYVAFSQLGGTRRNRGLPIPAW